MSTNQPVVNHWIARFPVFLIALVVVLLAGYVVLAPLPAIQPLIPVTGNESSLQSGLEADAARYTAMAEFYIARPASIQRGIEADAARYTAMAEFHAARLQRSLEADAARYTAMGVYYSAWREGLQLTLEADAARYTAMARYYAGK